MTLVSAIRLLDSLQHLHQG